ncbi:MAG: alpha-galactosidase [Planctomycetota bacterium]
MPLRIAFIGAGSFGFTRTLVRDILLVLELRDVHIALHDIDEQAQERMAQILRKEITGNDLPATISTHLERKAALDGANYIISCVRIGGVEAFQTDIDIPLTYGIDQCVGDTLCIGGIMYGQRNVPQMLAFQRDAKAVAAEGCLFLNYANPMAINTWAALDAADRGQGVDTVGLCHGVEGGWWQIDSVLARLAGNEEYDWHDLRRHQRTQIVCAGINHQTWYVKIIHDGRLIGRDELLEAFEAHPKWSEREPVRIDVLRRFGCYSTESNGHLSEYVPWYRKRFGTDPTAAQRWVGKGDWIHGETGGYLRITTEARQLFDADFEKLLGEAGGPMDAWRRSTEHGSHIIEARETGRPYRGHFNVRNAGIIANLPDDCIVEAPGYVDRTGIQMSAGIELPQACAATCRASIDVQRMAKDAAVAGDVTLLKQAVLHDPLTASICEPEEIWQMVDEMLVAQRRWLPNYSNVDIDAARERLAQHDRNGTRVKRRTWKGAARKPVRTVEQLHREESSAMLSADKAAANRTPASSGVR